MAEEVKYLQGNLRDEEFQDKLLEALNPRETKRLLKIITDLVTYGWTDLYLICSFRGFNKYVWVYDGDRPEIEDGGCTYKPGQLGGYWLNGAPQVHVKEKGEIEE